MEELFLDVLTMSFTASYVILVVILVRLLLKKAPKSISYALWIVAAFRLAIPFSFESSFSLIPRNTVSITTIRQDNTYQRIPQTTIESGTVGTIDINPLPAPAAEAGIDPIGGLIEILPYIWIIGMAALLVYSISSVLMLKRRLKDARLIGENLFEAGNLKMPFVFGLIKPEIYLPAGLSKEEQNYIILHEKIHIRRKDHIIKILAFTVLAVHWFNPLVWVAFILMSADMELSCDERVLREMGVNIKKPYASTLLFLASGRYILNGSPLAFGEGNVKGRIKNVLNYKKQRSWVIISAIVIVAVVGTGLVLNPPGSEPDLSFLNLRNLSVLAHQRDELLVSRAPGKTETVNVSARAIAECLDSAQWTVIKMDSPPEYSPSLVIEWNEAVMLMLYESDSHLAMVRVNDQWRCYRISQKDYTRLLTIIETGSDPQSEVSELKLKQKHDFSEALQRGEEIKLPDFRYDGDDPIEKLVYATEMEKNSMPDRGFTVIASKIFGSYEEKDMLKVFVTTCSSTFRLYGSVLELEGGSVVPSAITYKKGGNGSYQLEKYEQAQDGAYFVPSIKEFCRMPVSGRNIRGLADKIINHYTDREDLHNLFYNNLSKHLRANGINEAVLYYPDGEIEFLLSDPRYSD